MGATFSTEMVNVYNYIIEHIAYLKQVAEKQQQQIAELKQQIEALEQQQQITELKQQIAALDQQQQQIAEQQQQIAEQQQQINILESVKYAIMEQSKNRIGILVEDVESLKEQQNTCRCNKRSRSDSDSEIQPSKKIDIVRI